MVEAMGFWGQKWVTSELSLQESRSVAADVGHAAQSQPVAAARPAHGDPVPVSGPAGVQAHLVAGRSNRTGEVDLCWSDPGFDVDLYVSTDLRTMTAIWMGLTTVQKERENMLLTGAQEIARQCRHGWA